MNTLNTSTFQQLRYGLVNNNHWQALSSQSYEHQIESKTAVETNKLAEENKQKHDFQIICS